MNQNSHIIQANRGHQPSDCLKAQETEIDLFRSLCVCATDARWAGMLFGCVWLALLITSGNVVAQEKSETPHSTQGISKKEQLASQLQALRAANMQREVVQEPEEPAELFLDLSNGSTSAVAETQNTQAMASNLDVAMSSSPTQVLMRAVAWIAIVLCVCCLGILGARHWQRQRGLLPTISSQSKVIETLSLGPSRTVSLIEMHGYRALVATDAGGIRSLVLAPSPFEDSLMQEEVSHDP